MPLEFDFASLWMQKEMSDIQLVIKAAAAGSDDGTDTGTVGHEVLATIPAHKVVLSNSAFFKAQILRWHQEKSGTDNQPSHSRAKKRRKLCQAEGSHASDTPVLPVILQHASQEPAALAVLSALYGVKPIRELLSELTDDQQLQAALLADMWQIPVVATTAVQLLVDASKQQGLSEAAVAPFIQLTAIPDFLLPVFSALVASSHDKIPVEALKGLLLRVLGDLEGVWADEALARGTLLKLPLPAMELLLSCDELKVASEDTVLYTAQAYVDAITDRQQHQAARQQLAPVIRCQHLSLFWLSALASSDDAPTLLLGEHITHVKTLLLLRHGHPAIQLTAAQLDRLLPGAPRSWALPKRCSREISSVQLTWRLDIDTLRSKVQRTDGQPELVKVFSEHPGGSIACTPPLGGLTFSIRMCSEWEPEKGGAAIGLYVQPVNAPRGTFYSYRFTLGVCGSGPLSDQYSSVLKASGLSPSGGGWGWRDFFEVGHMVGGWDESAWAAQGLPTSGELVITATVDGVHL